MVCMSRTLKIFVCNVILYTYCTLNDKHVEDVGDDKNTYYVDF